MTELVLNAIGATRVRAMNPWVMAKDVLQTRGRAPLGSTVTLVDHDGHLLAKAAISPESKIRARVWHWNVENPVDHAWFKTMVAKAHKRRVDLGYGANPRSAYRMISAEGDGLPGVTIDRYGDSLVVQLTTAGAERWRDAIVAAATEVTGLTQVYDRSDASVRELEGLPRTSGSLMGDDTIGSRAAPISVEEGDAHFLVDIQTGHKTGFYLDQAQNRQILAPLCTGRDVLNCFSYTGGFGISAAHAGAASVVNVDSSAPALELGARSLEPFADIAVKVEWLRSDVKKAMGGFADDQRSFDVIVLDPPKLAPTRKSVKKALGLYSDLNRRALSLLNPGGVLATFSCSGAISMKDFKGMQQQASGEVGATVAVERTLTAGPDHVASLGIGDESYLKGLLLRRVS